MLNRLFLVFILLLAALALAGCPDTGPGGTGASPKVKVSTADSLGHPLADNPRDQKYPIDFNARPYKDVHPAVKEAWFLVETAYVVVRDKFDGATGEQRQAVQLEIEKNIFGVNEKVESLFKKAIEEDPDNPLNYAAYAFYLKPRKRITEGGWKPLEPEALAQIDKAIELAPDDPAFYIQKVFILATPHRAHDWLRAGALEELAINAQLDMISEQFTQAEKYDPTNHFFNYWHAMLLYRYTPDEEKPTVYEQILREIKAGNAKPSGYFVFPPPLKPYSADSRVIVFTGAETEAIFADHWVQNGYYDQGTVNAMVEDVAGSLSWPKDRDDFAALMFFYYNLGRTQPFDRTYFSMQQMLLDKMRTSAGPDSADKAKFAEVGRFLTAQFQTVGSTFFEVKQITDPAKVNVVGVNEVEAGAARQPSVAKYTQPRQASYLKHFGETFGIEFPLPEDPAKW